MILVLCVTYVKLCVRNSGVSVTIAQLYPSLLLCSGIAVLLHHRAFYFNHSVEAIYAA